MERRDRNRYRDRDRRRYENSEHHRPNRDRDRQKDRSRSRRRSSSKSRQERDRNHRRSRSSSCNRNKRSRHRSRSKKEYREEKEQRKSTPPPPSISTVESIISYQSSPRKEKEKEVSTKELLKQSSPDVILQFERHNKKPGAYCNLRPDEPIDKEKIHKEIEEKLRETLAREGIEYNAPKPEATHPVFANDGSFLEIFKKMQEAQQPENMAESQLHQASTLYAPPMMSTSILPLRPQLPIFGRRRGGKILKTGVVAKPKNTDNDSNTDPKDFWTIYLREVNKYKNAACDSDAQSRPLVK